MILPRSRLGLRKLKELIPEDLKPVISLSDESLPNVIIVATRTAIGAASDNIEAELYTINLRIVPNVNPFPRNLSRCLIMNCVNNTNTITNKDSKKGGINSLNIYLFIIFTN